MHEFSHEMTTGRIVFGAGALDRVAEEAARLGAHRVLLIYGPYEKPWADRIADGLGGRAIGRIEEAAQHVPAEVARTASGTADDLDVDLLLSVGGGSSTGLAKAVALDRGLPILAVPTTYSGSEMSDIWGLTEAQDKAVGRDPRVRPRTVVYDPETTFAMPAELTATSGMNALAHAVEALYAPDLSPVVALLAEEAVRLLARALPVCVARPADLRSRSEALYGACLSGIALGNAVMGVHHKVCHVLGGTYGLPHGGVHSVLLPYAAGFNSQAAPGAMRRITAALGTADAPVGLWELARRIGAPSNLASLGFDPTAIDEAAAAIAASPPRNPRPVTERGVRELLEAACGGLSPRGDAVTSAFVYDAVRTPFGKFNGALSGVRPDDLAAVALQAIVSRTRHLDPHEIDEVLLGNANGAGEDNRNVARMALLLAGYPVTVSGSTVNRLCGSSLDAVMAASRAIESGDADIVVAGGVESMTRAPWVLPKPDRAFPARDVTAASTTLGWRLVNPTMSKQWTVSLGEANEQLQEEFGISRERQDEFAARSHRLAAEAWESGFYDHLVVQVEGAELTRDESIRPGTTSESLAGLTPSFRPDGTITAGNASPLNDGASAVLLGSADAAQMLSREPLARIAGRAASALEPHRFGYAPVAAANRALERAGIGWSDVGAVELNEAFAVQSLACIDAWKVDLDIVNTRGGAIAIGHPLGASGGRILGTLARTLREDALRWGVAAICIGVGQGLAVVLENEAAR